MKKYALTLLPFVAVAFFTGCDSNCCGEPTVKKKNTQDPQNNPPVAKIGNYADNAVIECTPGETVQLANNSSDPDNNLDTTQTVWNTTDGTGNVTCPADGQTLQVCLTATDQGGLNDRSCVTLKGKAVTPQTQPPVAKILLGASTGDGQYLDCSQVHDTDTLHTYPNQGPYLYGNNNPKDIKEITWEYTYYADANTVQSGPHTKTQTAYNQDEGLPAGTCKKWFHNANVHHLDLKVTVVDDDQETNTTEYTLDFTANPPVLTQK